MAIEYKNNHNVRKKLKSLSTLSLAVTIQAHFYRHSIYVLMVRGRKRSNTKPPSPCRQNWMFRSLDHCRDIMARENKNLKLSLLPYKELIMDNGDLSTK